MNTKHEREKPTETPVAPEAAKKVEARKKPRTAHDLLRARTGIRAGAGRTEHASK